MVADSDSLENKLDSLITAIATLSTEYNQLAERMEAYQATSESNLHDLSNRIQVTHSKVDDLALSIPAPILEDDWEDNPSATLNPTNQPTPSPPPVQAVPKTHTLSDPLKSQITELTTALSGFQKAQADLPSRLERGTLQALLATLDLQKQLTWGVGLLLGHAALTTVLVILGLHLFPAPLHPQNEGQLFQIYQKIR